MITSSGTARKFGIERAHHDDRPFDEAGDFLEQALVVDDGEALREGEVVGVGADDVLAAVEVEDDLGLLERRHVVVEAPHLDRRRARGSGGRRWSGRTATLPAVNGMTSGSSFSVPKVAVMARSGRTQLSAAVAPAHRLGPGEAGDDFGQDVGEDRGRVGALLFDVGDVELALLGVGLDLRLVDRGQARGLEEAVDRLLRGADARALLFFAGVGRAGRDAGDGERQAARRDEGLGALVDEALVDQRVGDGLLAGPRRPCAGSARGFPRRRVRAAVRAWVTGR